MNFGNESSKIQLGNFSGKISMLNFFKNGIGKSWIGGRLFSAFKIVLKFTPFLLINAQSASKIIRKEIMQKSYFLNESTKIQRGKFEEIISLLNFSEYLRRACTRSTKSIIFKEVLNGFI